MKEKAIEFAKNNLSKFSTIEDFASDVATFLGTETLKSKGYEVQMGDTTRKEIMKNGNLLIEGWNNSFQNKIAFWTVIVSNSFDVKKAKVKIENEF